MNSEKLPRIKKHFFHLIMSRCKRHVGEWFLESLSGRKWATPKAKAETGTSAGLGVGVQVRGIMGEKVLLLIAALELWPALWNTKGRSDTLQWLGLVNIFPTSGMPRFLLASPTNPSLDPHIHFTFCSLSSGLTHLGATARPTHNMHAHSACKACWELFSNSGEADSLPFLLPSLLLLKFSH